ncbi:bcl-2-binding component 3, isoforms 3/4-like [Hirundo rustica]|uniref:bcl-2-binding component 3, isoforms 3/4-like n=1 Tax=Hirundo rustica TaxID=43150 RepID=UPI001A93B7BC|nr:bcl-2-binding component 3, isoforms 3/4-like [Hirundo rustica]
MSPGPTRAGGTGPGTAPLAARWGSGERRRAPRELWRAGNAPCPGRPGEARPSRRPRTGHKVPAGERRLRRIHLLRRPRQCSARDGRAGWGHPRLPAPQPPQSAGEELFRAPARPRPPAVLSGLRASGNPPRDISGRCRTGERRCRRTTAHEGAAPSAAGRAAGQGTCTAAGLGRITATQSTPLILILPSPQPPYSAERGAGGTHGRNVRRTTDYQPTSPPTASSDTDTGVGRRDTPLPAPPRDLPPRAPPRPAPPGAGDAEALTSAR